MKKNGSARTANTITVNIIATRNVSADGVLCVSIRVSLNGIEHIYSISRKRAM